LFTNFLKISGEIEKVPLESPVHLDVSHARYLDHSFMEKLHEFSKYRIQSGGHFRITGMEQFKTSSDHPLSSRKSLKQG
jgi:hypothetical protein